MFLSKTLISVAVVKGFSPCLFLFLSIHMLRIADWKTYFSVNFFVEIQSHYFTPNSGVFITHHSSWKILPNFSWETAFKEQVVPCFQWFIPQGTSRVNWSYLLYHHVTCHLSPVDSRLCIAIQVKKRILESHTRTKLPYSKRIQFHVFLVISKFVLSKFALEFVSTCFPQSNIFLYWCLFSPLSYLIFHQI